VAENVDLVRSIYSGWERGDVTRAESADPANELIRPVPELGLEDESPEDVSAP
jgi:hypothetical protein